PALRELGHEPCSHGYRWGEHFQMSEEEERREIQLAVAAIERCVGARPIGWYCRYAASERTRRLLAEEGGLLYGSDAYHGELPGLGPPGPRHRDRPLHPVRERARRRLVRPPRRDRTLLVGTLPAAGRLSEGRADVHRRPPVPPDPAVNRGSGTAPRVDCIAPGDMQVESNKPGCPYL